MGSLATQDAFGCRPGRHCAVAPRGRIVFDRSRDLFILYADRKLLTQAMVARIATQFHLPAERTEIQSDLHYQSNETPRGLCNQTASEHRANDV
jgi:hypothetical protein